jgi:hypothetical protein
MIYTLMIWTAVVGVNPSKSVYDWRHLGGFQSLSLCQDAAKVLGINKNRYRCVLSKEK